MNRIDLPALPEPVDYSDVPSFAHVWGYATDQMISYGESCARVAIELAARIAEGGNVYGIASDQIARAIRAEMTEPPDA